MPTMPYNGLANLALAAPDRAEPAKIWKARSYIQEHLEEELSLAKVANFVHISPNYLSEKFKEVTGVKFVDYIARRRFAKACLLLLDPDLRISEIAFEVGFQSLSQFNRVFKKFSGKSPTEYRAHECKGTTPGPNGFNNVHQLAKTLAVEMRSRSSMISNTLRHREAVNGHAVAPKQR
jgi:AraC-like DNA-binding protein